MPDYTVLLSESMEFDDIFEMIDYVESTEGEGSPSSRIASNIKFKSYNEAYLEALQQIIEAKTIESHDELLAKFKGLVILEDSIYKPIVRNSFYGSIMNQDRIYLSSGMAYKVMDNEFIVETKKQNVGDLMSLNSIENLDTENFRLIQYGGTRSISELNGERVSSSCSNYMEAQYTKNKSGCKNDRRVLVSADLYRIVSGSYTSIYSEVKVWGRKKTAIFCNWVDYSTTLKLRNATHTVTYYVGTAPVTQSRFFYDYQSEVDEPSAIGRWTVLPPTTGTPLIIGEKYDYVHSEASSRGVGDNWVTLHCP